MEAEERNAYLSIILSNNLNIAQTNQVGRSDESKQKQLVSYTARLTEIIFCQDVLEIK